MAKNIFKLLFVLVVFGIGLYLFPLVANFDGIKDNLITVIKNDAGVDAKVQEVNIHLVPIPKIVAKQVSLTFSPEKIIEIPELEIGSSLFSIFSNEITINNLNIVGLQVTVEDLLKFTQKVSDKSNNILKNLRSVSVTNLNVIINPTSNFIGKVTQITGEVDFGDLNQLDFQGSFNIDDISYEAELYLPFEDKKQFKFSLESQYLNAKIDGIVESAKDQFYEGKAFIKLDPAHLHKKPNPSLFLLSVLSEKPEIAGNFFYKNGEFQLQNLKLSSDNIKDASADFSFSLGHTTEFNYAMNIDEINLDNIYSRLNIKQKEQVKNYGINGYVKNLLQNFDYDIPENLSGSIDCKIKSIIANNDKITDLNLNANIFEGRFVLSQANLTTPGSGLLNVSGVFSHNNIRPKFEGDLSLNVTNFDKLESWLHLEFKGLNLNEDSQRAQVKANITIIPRNLRLDNLKFDWGSFKAMGKVSYKYDGSENLIIRASNRINQIVADRLGIAEEVESFITNMYLYDLDKEGRKFAEFTDDFKWLRNFADDISIDALVDQVDYKGEKFDNTYFSFRINRNNLKVNRVSLSHPDLVLNGNFNLNLSGVTPTINMYAGIDHVNEDIFTKIFPSFTALQEVMVKKKAEVLEVVGSDLEDNLKGFNFFGVTNFTGEINLKVDKYTGKDLSFKNLDSNIKLMDGLVAIPRASVEVYGGKLDLVGNLGLSTQIPTFSFSFALNNVDMGKMISSWYGYNNLSGYISTSGTLISKGVTFVDSISNLNGNLKLLGKQIVWKTFDIGEIIRLTEGRFALKDRLEHMNYYKDNGQTIFDDLKGDISIYYGLATLTNFNVSNARSSGSYAAKFDMKNNLINSITRFSFIPFGQNQQLIVDVASQGKLSDLKTTLNLDSLTKFFETDEKNLDVMREEERARQLLRNRPADQQ